MDQPLDDVAASLAVRVGTQGRHDDGLRMLTIRWPVLGVAFTRGAFPAWLVVGGVSWAGVIGWGLSWIFSMNTSAAVRYAGTLLQILGLVTVAIGLREMLKLFPGRSSGGSRVREWFRSVAAAFRRPQPAVVQAQAAGMSFVTGKPRVRRGVGPDASVEQRLEVLEGNLNALQEELDAEIRDLTTKIERLGADLGREENERTQADDRITRLVEEVTIGGLNLEVVGLLWLALGVLSTGFADEAAKLVSVLL